MSPEASRLLALFLYDAILVYFEGNCNYLSDFEYIYAVFSGSKNVK